MSREHIHIDPVVMAALNAAARRILDDTHRPITEIRPMPKGTLTALSETRWSYKLGKRTYYVRQTVEQVSRYGQAWNAYERRYVVTETQPGDKVFIIAELRSDGEDGILAKAEGIQDALFAIERGMS